MYRIMIHVRHCAVLYCTVHCSVQYYPKVFSDRSRIHYQMSVVGRCIITSFTSTLRFCFPGILHFDFPFHNKSYRQSTRRISQITSKLSVILWTGYYSVYCKLQWVKRTRARNLSLRGELVDMMRIKRR